MYKKCKTCGVEKPLEDFNKNNNTKDKLEYSCRSCSNERVRKWREANADAFKKSQKASQKKYQDKPENKERHREHCKTYRTKNPEKAKQSSRDYRKRKPSAGIVYRKIYNKTHRAEKNANLWKYRAAKRQALVKWADTKSIQVIYAKCHRLSRWLDLKHHVDHIIPLQSEFVCGLHCEANLRIITQTENTSKGNRHWPDMW